MGIPGESRAIDIAERNGVPSDIIKKARSYIDEERSDVSALITGLKQKRRELDVADEERRREEKRLMEERRKADLKDLRLRQKELEIKTSGVGKLKYLLEESRKTLENLVRELKEGEITREKTLKVKEFLHNLEESAAEEEASLNKELISLRQDHQKQEFASNGGSPGMGIQGELRAGMEVFVGAYKQQGTIIRQDKNVFVVEVGSVRMSVPLDELVPAPSQKTLKPAMPITDLASGTAAYVEINLLGMRFEEALDVLQRQIDAAVLSGLRDFSVIHGKGSGVLQQGVHHFLKNEPRVADFHFSRPEMGGSGRTEVTLKE
jgi:DNA mismatch repair protein MutS2